MCELKLGKKICYSVRDILQQKILEGKIKKGQFAILQEKCLKREKNV